MAIAITCKGCGKQFSVNDSLVGKRGKCKCGTIFTIAAPVEEEMPATFDDIDFSQVAETQPTATAAGQSSQSTTVAVSAGKRGAAPARSGVGGVGGRADANELIDAGAKFGRIKKLFPSAESALLYIANRQAALYGRRSAGGPCVCCNKPSASVRQFSWKAQSAGGIGLNPLTLITLFFGFLVVRTKWKYVKFNSYHAVCGSCIAGAAFRRVLAFVGLILGLPLLVLGACLVIIVFADSSMIFGVVGAVLAVLGLGLIFLGSIWGGWAPLSMRRLVCRPFYCKYVKSI